MKKQYLIFTLIIICILSGSIIFNYSRESLYESEITLKNKEGKIYKTYNHLSPEIRNNAQRVDVLIELIKEYTPEYMLSLSDAVVVSSIISIDGADTEVSHAFGNTYGKMVINNTIYGEIKEGIIVEYLKSGGIMPLEEYEKYEAKNLIVCTQDNNWQFADIEIKYASDYIPASGEESNELDKNVWGNHLITVAKLPDTNILLTIDPTNPSIGVIKNGRIYTFSTPDKNGLKTPILGNMIYGVEHYIDTGIINLESFILNDKPIEVLESEYGIDCQNKILEKIRKNDNIK